MQTAENVTVIPAKNAAIESTKYHQTRVAAYCRVSTELEEQQNSYQVQISYYTDFINRKREWTLAGIFADEGISGTQTKHRTEFNRMIRLCRQKKIDLILCKSISRFARNTVDCLEYVRQLKELGIGVLFEKENINTLTMTSEFMIALYGSFAQAESESISKNVSWGVEKAFQSGKVRYQYKYWLGYQRGADGKPEIVAEEAETIRRVFTLFLDGLSLQNIAKQLETEGRKNYDGKAQWQTIAVKRILQNEKYAGDALLQKTFTADCITHKKVRNTGEKSMYLVTDCHPAIIERDLFNLAQQELARRSAKRKKSEKATTEQGKYSSKYALTELLICGECGTPYRRCTWTSNGKPDIVWRCISRLDHGKQYCHSSPTMRESKLQAAILRAINQFFECEEDISRLLKSNAESVMNGLESSEIRNLEQRLREIDKTRNDMASLIANGAADEDSLDAEFAKLYAEEQDLNAKLSALKGQNRQSATERKRTERTISELKSERFELRDYDEILIRKLIECVKVISKTELLVIFKGGYEVSAEVEK